MSGTAVRAEEPHEPGRDAADLWRRAGELVGAFGPPLTVVTALLIYFGWARSDAQARDMGLDVSLFGYSPQDYVFLSIPSLFQPLVWLSVAVVLWAAADAALTRRIAAGSLPKAALAAVRAGTAVGWAAAAVLWAVALAAPRLGLIVLPYAMAGALLLAAWGQSVLRRVSPPAGRGRRGLERAVVFILVTLLLFWGTADYAQGVGRGLAADLERRSASLPSATVYSPARLAVGVEGVSEEPIGTEDAPLYRYEGLRLLVVSGGRVFLLNDGWTLRDGRVIVLPDDGSTRIEYANPAAP